MADGQWIVHRTHGVGEVLERKGRSLLVRFSDGDETVDKLFRTVAADGLDVRAHRDPNGFARELEADPARIAMEVLTETRDGLTEKGITRRLVKLGVSGESVESWWPLALEALAKREAVEVVDGEPPRWRLVGSAPSTEDRAARVLELLEELAKKRLGAKRRAAVCAELSDLATTTNVGPSELAAASALGCRLFDVKTELAAINVRALSAKVLEALVERAGEVDASFLAAAAIDARGEEVAAKAIDSLRRLVKGPKLAATVAEQLRTWTLELEAARGKKRGEVATAIAERLRRAGKIAEGISTPLLVSASIELDAVALRTGSDKGAIREARRSIVRFLNRAGIAVDDVSNAVSRLPEGVVADRLLARIADADLLSTDSVRLTVLAGLANSPRRSAVLLEEAWQTLTLAELVELWEEEPVKSVLLGTTTGRSIAAAQVARAVRAADRRTLALLLERPEVLSLIAPPDLAVGLSNLIESDSSLARMIEALAVPQLDRVRREVDERRVRAEAQHLQEKTEADAKVVTLEQEKARLEERVVFVEDRLQRAVREERASVSGGELRAARLDGLSALAELLSEVERHESRDPGLSSLLDTLVTMAAGRGVVRLGTPGELVTFDPKHHRMLSGDRAQSVEIVESGWACQSETGDDAVTVIRYATVREA